jgi:ribosomal protein L11 methyltransferase
VSGKTWQAVEMVAAGDAHEAIEYGLMEAGALGTESNETAEGVHVTGYFDRPVSEAKVRAELSEALRIYNSPAAVGELQFREVADADWLSEWKKNWQPVAVGRFIIAPPWTAVSASERIVIRIEPGMAFGTGTHETTRLCLKAIDKYFRGGSFLDVGTGTGILAIGAAKLFPEARVEACDTDEGAIEIAKENARMNQVGDHIDFRAGTIGAQTASADMVCANLTAPVIVELLPALLGVTCGTLVLSGILESQIEMVQQRLTELSAAVREFNQDGEWTAVVV